MLFFFVFVLFFLEELLLAFITPSDGILRATENPSYQRLKRWMCEIFRTEISAIFYTYCDTWKRSKSYKAWQTIEQTTRLRIDPRSL